MPQPGQASESRIVGANFWVFLAAVGALIIGATACSTPAPQPQVLAASLKPHSLAEPIALARLDGPLAQCLPPAAQAADHGLCNVVGKVLTFTTARSVQAVGTDHKYFVQVQLSPGQQHALNVFLKPIGPDEVGIAIGDNPLMTMQFVGPPGDRLVFWFATAAEARQLFNTLTGRD